MVGLVQVVNLLLKLSNTFPIGSTRPLEACATLFHHSRRSVNHEKIENGGETEEKIKHHPEPFLSPGGIDGHPQLEDEDDQDKGIGNKVPDIR